jgi:hypothetical protein
MPDDNPKPLWWEAALKWGFGVVALTAVSIVIWGAFSEQNAFIRETLLQVCQQQSEVISQNSELIKMNNGMLERCSREREERR